MGLEWKQNGFLPAYHLIAFFKRGEPWDVPTKAMEVLAVAVLLVDITTAVLELL